MENYSRELLYQDDRIGYMSYFANTFEERVPRRLDQLEKLYRTPFRNIAKPFLTRAQKRDHFGAIRYSSANKKVEIDVRQYFGCGVCRAACHNDAITLHARSADPVAIKIW